MCKNINIVILSLIFCSISQATIAPPLNPPTPSVQIQYKFSPNRPSPKKIIPLNKPSHKSQRIQV